jgi:hypothetical protein
MASKFVVYETYKVDEPEKNYIGKSSIDKIVGRRHYKGSGLRITRAMKKHGRDMFDIRILGEYEKETEAYDAEVQFIENHKPFYNMNAGGKGQPSGENHPLFGVSSWNKGVPCTEHKKNLLRDHNIGKTYSIETNLKKASKGKKNGRFRHDIDTMELIRLREKGLSYREIGDIYGIKRKTVSHRINKIGIADGN